MWRLALVLIILTISCHPPNALAANAPATNAPAANAQVDQLLADADNKAPSAETRISDPAYNALMMEQEKSRRHLVVGLLIAMVLSQILVLWSLVRSHQSSASAVVHGSGLVLVVYATVIVVMLARADQQLTAAIGILGAIAGYLFGSATREPGTSRS